MEGRIDCPEKMGSLRKLDQCHNTNMSGKEKGTDAGDWEENVKPKDYFYTSQLPYFLGRIKQNNF